MGIVYPAQHITVNPFTDRRWDKVNQSSAVIYPFLDINDALDEDAQVKDALTRPLQGEIYEGDEEDYTIMIGGVGHCFAEGLMDSTSGYLGDTALRISEVDTTTLSVSPGSCLIAGIFVEYIDTVTIDLYDSDSYRWPDLDYATPVTWIAGKTYVVCAGFEGDIDDADARFYLLESGTFATFREAVVGLSDTLTEKALIMLGAYTVDVNSRIDEISDSFTRSATIWKRDIIPQAPDVNPLNGGVVRAAGWMDDWS